MLIKNIIEYDFILKSLHCISTTRNIRKRVDILLGNDIKIINKMFLFQFLFNIVLYFYFFYMGNLFVKDRLGINFYFFVGILSL